MDIIFSGIQPTGNLHLGNYLGAIRNWVQLQKDKFCIFCVVDLHAITVWQAPDKLRQHTREVVAAMIASGIDSEKQIIFNQSRVSGHAELAWIFNCVSRIGWLNRMTQFKEKAGRNRENASVGLFAYPNLMAADILLYKGTQVPVGADQKQHLELTRDIAQKFNSDFGIDFFPIVEPLILGEATRVMSLRDGMSKMSKSDPSELSRVTMVDDSDLISKKIRKAKTDPNPLPHDVRSLEGRPEAQNLMAIFAALSDTKLEIVCERFGGLPFSKFKEELIDLAVAVLSPIQSEMVRLLNDPAELDRILSVGSERANALAYPTMQEIKKIVGLLSE
ncbi:MAG: Tryptophan--tRNA ligase [Alphaproteobacteria bacterium MarineAlpha3_Bin5]|nr:tryptophan--tRNA ligase [Magnetovibrio sp.]PPR78993.1 MAG: Tryptophan--tRNA ligase [Alphaproteobacteria bacterium MarineAlpha3_Bin5]|tara:strand:- start:145 stop:1143 length:999 start_codon:yes stop_codon:yes gene_type:complete